MSITTTSSASSTANTDNVTKYTGNTSANAYGTAAANGGTLTQSDFLNLLSSQLQNQDPTDPESNTDFAAQMAQFSSLSEMDSLNSNMTNFIGLDQLSSGSSLIGKTVTTSLTDSNGNAFGGVVQSVATSKGSLTLDVDGQSIPYSDVTGVQPTATTMTTGASTATGS